MFDPSIYEYRFKIGAFTPETIPLTRLAQYLSDLARMMGESSSVHLSHLEAGSTMPVVRIDSEAVPKVRDRLRALNVGDGPPDARRAFKEINKKLVEDNANGVLLDASRDKVILFPGRDAANQPEFGPYSQSDFLQGVPIRLGGEGDLVPIHLEDGDEKHIVSASRRVAKNIAPYLFTSTVRVDGKSRWTRNRLGDWVMLDFVVQDFEVLADKDLKQSIAALREIPGDWKQLPDPLGFLADIRSGGEAN